MWRFVSQNFTRWQRDTPPDNIQGLDSAHLQNFESEAAGFMRERTRTKIKKSGIMENVIQNWITGGRFKIFVDEIKGIGSLGTDQLLVFIGATQMEIVSESGPDGRIIWREMILGAQLGICLSGPESSVLMLSQFLLIILSILAKPRGDWIGRRLLLQGKGRWEVEALPNPATRSRCFAAGQNRAIVTMSMVHLNFMTDLIQLVSCYSSKRTDENLPKLDYSYQSCARLSGKKKKEKQKRLMRCQHVPFNQETASKSFCI
jgi:hypothetical protein